MPNMKSAIQNHNANLLSKLIIPVAASSCTCHQKLECPLHNVYLKVLSIKQQFHKHLHK